MATTLEELVVKLEADNKQFMQAMMQTSTQTQKSMEAMSKSVEEMAKNGNKQLSFFEQSMASMAGFVGGAVVTGAFNAVKDAASAMFQTFVVDGVAASSEAIDNMNRLNFALAQTNKYSKDVSDGFADWANELQKTTKYEDDAIIKSAAFIQTLGKLDQDGLKRATEGAMNLASALGIDLDTATKMVGKAAAGETAAFGKLGLEIQKGATASQTFANTLKVLESLGPAATKSAESFSGAQARLNHMFGENQEAIGGLITKNVAVVDVMGEVAKIFGESSDAINDNQLFLRTLVAQGLVVAIDAATLFAASLDQMLRVGTAAFNGVMAVAISSITPIAKMLNMIGVISDDTYNGMLNTAHGAIKGVVTAFTDETTMGMIGVKLAEIGIAAENGLGKVAMGAEALPEVQNRATATTVELTEAVKALVTEGENLAKSYAEANVSGKAMAEQQIADAQIMRDEKIRLMNEESEAKWMDLTTQEERNLEALAIEEEFLAAKLEANNMAREAEELAVMTAAENEALSEEQKQIALAGIRKKYGDMDMAEKRKMTDFKKKLDDEEVKNREAQISVLAGLQSSQNAYAKTVGKAYAVADTIIKTQQGAQAAYAAMAGIPFVGPALGAAAAAAVIADGATRIATIRGAQTGITEVPGIGTRDTFGPVALAPGERVVPGETNQDLKAAIGKILSGESGGAAQVQIMVGFTDNALDIIETKMVERMNLGISVQGA